MKTIPTPARAPKPLFAAVALLLIFAAPIGHADIITYTFRGSGSGRLGDSNFTNASVLFTANADTTQITHPFSSSFDVLNLNTSLTIGGIGSATFTTNFHTLAFNNPNPSESGVGLYLFYQRPELTLLRNSAFQSYNLRTAHGIEAGTPGFGPAIFPTTGGGFDLTSFSAETFTATIQPAPEPSGFALLGWGSVALAIRLRPKLTRYAPGHFPITN